MTPDEIWLRLMKVSSLYGDRMVEIAQRLCAAASVDHEALHAVGMTAAQATLFSGLTSMSLTRRGAGWNNRIIICYGVTIRAIHCG